MTVTVETLYELRRAVEAANEQWFEALRSGSDARDAKAVFNAALAEYRSYEERALDANLTETCGRCGGNGTVDYGRITYTVGRRTDRFCFQCHGARVQCVRKHRFEAQAPTRLKRMRENEAKRAAERAERDRKWTAFAAEHAEVAEFLSAHRADEDADLYGADHFLVSMARAVEKWGGLTDKQMDATRRSMERARAEAARREAVATHAFPRSGETVEGEIVKLVPGRGYTGGTVYRALIVLTTGHKVLGTTSAKFYDGADRLGTTVEGLRVRFMAEFERRDDDFGFFKSPKRVEVLGTTREAMPA